MASLKVAVRVRPFNNREREMNAKSIVQMDGEKTRLLKKPENVSIDSASISSTFHDFTFDYSYWSGDGPHHIVSQKEIYDDLGVDVIECAFQGYNACLLAYGQTGSGKTFTMMGSQTSPGLIPRICKELFKRMKVGQKSGTGYKTNVSYLEIYNERVKDLLGDSSESSNLRIREHRETGPYVEGLSQHTVIDYSEIEDCIDRGNRFRTTASTKMNDTSSRSHAIFTITFVQAIFMNNTPSETVSKIHLVDLAGSERANATEATGDRLKEGAHINKSLVSLGSVISTLAEQATISSQKNNTKKRIYIPYRDSILTWLLKDSLGGNSKTIMIAAISPADCNYSETLSTLRYANRAKNIINKPTINEDPNVKLIRELREEIMKLKGMLSSADINDVSQSKSSQMLEDLLKKEAQEKFLTEEWAEKWRQTQTILREEKTLGLRKSGFGGIVLNCDAPHLVGIHDANSTGVTLYSLKEGETIIGNEEKTMDKVDIALMGTGIQPLHCSIILTNCTAKIHPHVGAQCWLNANLVTSPQSISQGDILLFGRTNMFRYCNPMEAAKLQSGEPNKTDLSRLSLIAASRENLSENSVIADVDSLELSSFRKQRLEDIKEHRKLLETIENALHKLNLERNKIFEQYSLKVQNLSRKLVALEGSKADEDSVLNCYEKLLIAKREMHSMNKMHKKTQIDIAVKQLSNLQLQMDSKQTDLNELTSTEQKEVDQLKVELLDEENALKQSIKEIAEMDEALLRIGEQFEELQEKIKQRNEEKNAKAEMGDSSLEQYEVEKKSEPQNVSMDNRGNCSTQMLHFGTAVQKDRKMKNIELNSCDKSQLMRDSEMNNYPNEEYDIDFPTTISTFADPSNQDEDHSNDNNTVSQSNSFMDRSQISVSDSEYIISIPSYVLRGAGKQTHFEYEIRITLPGEKWIIMRRYSRFRELHITMKTMYGEKVHQIPFPSRELFASKSESVARNRRRQLESYLRRLIVVCSKIPQCPFYEGSNGYGLNKKTLVEFSNFFKKGLFESGRHGTG